MKTFTFRFHNPKNVLLYLLLMILGPVLALVIIMAMNITSLAPFLAAILLPLGGGMYLMFVKGKAKDTIDLDNAGLTSEFYGRINFDDIEQIIDLPWYQRNPPSMSLRLKSGKKVRWNVTYRSNVFNNEQDAITFSEFTAALQRRLDSRYARKLQQREPVTAEDPAIQLKREETKNSKMAYWTVPLGFIFALASLIKACGKDWIKDRGPNFSKFTEMQEKKFDGNIRIAKSMVDSMSVAQGEVYLYSNDSSATIKLLPNLSVNEPTGIKLFELTANNEELDKFIEHPDSFELKMLIVGSDSIIKSMNKSMMNYGDSASSNLYIRCYDPKHLLAPPGSRRNEPLDSATARPFDVTTAIALYDTLKPGKAIGEAYPGMKIMLAQVKHSSSFRVYLAGRKQDGISAQLFQNSVYALNKQFAAVGVDTSKFVKHTFFEK
ncbi:hypothetical protein CLV59_105140 [Chitinophaga dinghuensis]|uniref:Uncharacterized protein n=1 Tax=Chitinophaga dinghuensis TaxID=1539050 RepID=A0A327VXH4_9BACT|nr:hypothetical protein [Chitinophaga dinghuensis]RAJ80033.1 hypothetical protein CLV59_105140 [Chitinophaga dinghuensis]